ncbi:MAG: class 1 fructose-bisphosphatase [Nitrospinae bacterium CG11_big_fil_rev_8_21_14_0_20_45_15]|nr:MAG: class 1 fructose-bisphosphatase [Nitrospinae bacterium CG11_big_fil_rev_8_21_14_0_20_45_15]
MEKTTLVQHIRKQERQTPLATGEFTELMTEIMVASKIISNAVNRAGIGEDIFGITGQTNVHGESVQKLDDFANCTFAKIIGQSGTVCAIASEEMEAPMIISAEENPGKYIFMMDPLDGSSNIDVNVSIGTIFSIYRKVSKGSEVTHEDLHQPASQQVAAGYVIYGPSTLFVYTSGEGVHGFTLDPSLGEFFLSHPDIKIPEQGSLYSINEGNTTIWSEKQKQLVSWLKGQEPGSPQNYRLRYVGTLVSDFHRTLLKGGIFMYPADEKSPKGKLRFSYEAAPMAFIVDQAGGDATDGLKRIMDSQPNDIHECTPLFIGSKKDIEISNKFLSE